MFFQRTSFRKIAKSKQVSTTNTYIMYSEGYQKRIFCLEITEIECEWKQTVNGPVNLQKSNWR